MRQNTAPDALEKITYLLGSAAQLAALPGVPARPPFDDAVIRFLNDVSRRLMDNRAAKAYPDVVTFAFWIRRASLLALQRRYMDDGAIRRGRGVAFHIAPSNVPVNFAYSLVTGLLTGNANVVRVPSKPFPQVDIIADAFARAMAVHPEMAPYALLVRYGRDRAVNDCLSAMADIRIVWGGDQTIAELRRSPLPPRALEIAFADRYSLAVIDSEAYLAIPDKARVAEDFYNDTYLTDQNACTSPRLVAWTGAQVAEAQGVFWRTLLDLVRARYDYQAIEGIDKLVQSCLAAAAFEGVRVAPREDNLLVRVSVDRLSGALMDYRGNCGFFYEYTCGDILELKPLCDDSRCQTVGYIGDADMLLPLIEAGVRGVDRIVPVGRTMDFDLIWDGYDLPRLLTRVIAVA